MCKTLTWVSVGRFVATLNSWFLHLEYAFLMKYKTKTIMEELKVLRKCSEDNNSLPMWKQGALHPDSSYETLGKRK